MAGLIVRGNALQLPLRDESVDLIVTSPPYFALRSYRDGGGHYQGQIGSEAHPQEWLEAVWAVMRELWRVLKPEGNCFINLGDKRAGSGGHNNSGVSKSKASSTGLQGGPQFSHTEVALEVIPATRRNAPDRYNQAAFGRPKSRMALPERFVIGCMDGQADPEGIGWIYRQDLIWHKLNGLPESVTDRHRDNFEHIFHFTKQERYFAAMDEIREAQNWNGVKPGTNHGVSRGDWQPAEKDGTARPALSMPRGIDYNSLGKLPGSVWPMASEPLVIPQWAKEKYGLPDHFAAFPTELPRKLILAFSPSGICLGCGQGRRPVVEKRVGYPRGRSVVGGTKGLYGDKHRRAAIVENHEATIIGYACACPEPTASTRKALVVDPFGGTGTVAVVANRLGRVGISLDLSADYCRLAQWRCANPPSKILERTWRERQGALL